MLDLDKRIIDGKMLKTLRVDSADRKVTIKEVSLQCQLSSGYISDIEHGNKTNISIESLQRLAMAYGCHLRIEFIKAGCGTRTLYDILVDSRCAKDSCDET